MRFRRRNVALPNISRKVHLTCQNESQPAGGEEEEEEEGLFKANAVNEEDPGRDRATPA